MNVSRRSLLESSLPFLKILPTKDDAGSPGFDSQYYINKAQWGEPAILATQELKAGGLELLGPLFPLSLVLFFTESQVTQAILELTM